MNEIIPLLRHALTSRSAFTPEALVSAVRAERRLPMENIPAVCVLDFDGDLNDWLIANHIAVPHPAWACFHTSMSAIEVDGTPCGIIPRTIGGPYAVLVAEQLLVSGARVVLGLTSAGRVLDSLPVPSLVVADRAVRDEGTSYHYLPPSETVGAAAGINDCLAAELQNLGLPLRRGCVWTTDAPYRETYEQLRQHSQQEVLAVEMQAASLFAFAQARNAVVGLIAHVTNAVGHDGNDFDKGQDNFGLTLVHALCRAGLRFVESHPGVLIPRLGPAVTR
ncbi:MAG: nucleoside phosphorylase [Acidobacteriota bacterium]|nr:nucleoside phosphorylase [Acidobacteriota bacterium]